LKINEAPISKTKIKLKQNRKRKSHSQTLESDSGEDENRKFDVSPGQERLQTDVCFVTVASSRILTSNVRVSAKCDIHVCAVDVVTTTDLMISNTEFSGYL
jgi:hypothetical protein